MLELSKIEEAYTRIKDIVVKTPFSFAPKLSQISGANIYLKKENLQLTGAFKLRGAFNKISTLSDEQKKHGVIAASAGNHAQGVAYSAKHYNINSVIVMPESTPLTKVNGVKELDSKVILHGSNYDEAYGYAMEYAKKHSLEFIHPFEDDEVIAGQGTCAIEILNECKDIDTIVVPVGGGGLIAGVASYVKAVNPKIKIIGVSACGAPAMKNSYDNKKAEDTLSVRTIADGIAVRDTSKKTLDMILEGVDQFVSVDDEEIASAMLFLLERQKLVVEGAGAVGIAALLHNKIKFKKDENVAILLSGGNVDVTLLSVIIEKGITKTARKLKLTVTLVDKPGSLKILTSLLEDLGANIVHIAYDRTAASLDYGDANVTIHLETKGEEHQQEIKKLLLENNYLSKDNSYS